MVEGAGELGNIRMRHDTSLRGIGSPAGRCNRRTRHPRIRQDTAVTVQWGQASLACVLEHREHIENYSSPALETCHGLDRLPPCLQAGVLSTEQSVRCWPSFISLVHEAAR